jgi:hypothetical protein
MTAAPVAWEFNGVRGFVHEGLLSAATYVHASTAGALEEAAQRCPGWPVLLTGTVAGGAAWAARLGPCGSGWAAAWMGCVWGVLQLCIEADSCHRADSATCFSRVFVACSHHPISLPLPPRSLPGRRCGRPGDAAAAAAWGRAARHYRGECRGRERRLKPSAWR